MPKIIITPSQCRAARELLSWNQEDLSNRSNISQATISNFERSDDANGREIRLGTLIDIINAFEEVGIRFDSKEGRYGVWVEE